MKKLFVLAVLSQLAMACTHLSSVSTSSIPQNRSNKVSAESKKMIFLGFNFSNDYVNNMAEDLASKCSGGKVEGVLTKQENIIYFPLFVHAVRVSAEGYCLKRRASR